MKPSALYKRLTQDQLVNLVTDARTMMRQYAGEMEASFYPDRREWERQANDDFSSRGSGDEDNPNIFDLAGNHSLNIVRNVTRFMKARCGEDIFGSKPYVAVAPAGDLDDILAAQMNRHGPWKLDQAGYSKMGKEGIGLALDLGEAIIKTTHRTDRDAYEQLTLVLVNKKTGEPIIAPLVDEAGEPRLNEKGEHEGDYIYPEDATMDSPAGPVFEKFPEQPFDNTVEFREVLVEQDDVTYHGLDVANVRFDAFIAPLNVARLEDAPAVGHTFSRKLSQLRALYATEAPENRWLFQQLATTPEGPKSPEDQPRDTYGEVSNGARTIATDPDIKVTEVCLRGYDVFGEGRGRNIFLVLAEELDEPLYVEYQANITVRGRLPFHVVAVNRVPGRWYGRGFYKLYEHGQRLIDTLVNNILLRNENNAEPFTCWQPDATEEGKGGEKRLIRRPGKTITLRTGKTAKDAVQVIEFPDLDERTWQLVQLIMQLIQTDSGVTSAAQGDYSALPSASTATGVSSILQSASTLHRMLTEDLKDGFEPAIVFALMTIYRHQDKDETFRYLEGKASEVLSLANARTLAQIELNVRVLLTRFQMREQREQAQLIIEKVLPQWVQMLTVSGLPTANVAAEAQKLFIQVAMGADIQHAEEIFVVPQRPPPEQTPPNSKLVETMSYKDVPEDIRRQMESAAGFKPSKLPPPEAKETEPAKDKGKSKAPAKKAAAPAPAPDSAPPPVNVLPTPEPAEAPAP